MSVTTLLLTFYLNKAFNLWRDIYDKGTKMKGRINDICMVLGEYHSTKLFVKLCCEFKWFSPSQKIACSFFTFSM